MGYDTLTTNLRLEWNTFSLEPFGIELVCPDTYPDAGMYFLSSTLFESSSFLSSSSPMCFSPLFPSPLSLSLVSYAYVDIQQGSSLRSIMQITYVTPYACRRTSRGIPSLLPLSFPSSLLPCSFPSFFSNPSHLLSPFFPAVFWIWLQLSIGVLGTLLFIFWSVRKSNRNHSHSLWEMFRGCWYKPQQPTFERWERLKAGVRRLKTRVGSKLRGGVQTEEESLSILEEAKGEEEWADSKKIINRLNSLIHFRDVCFYVKMVTMHYDTTLSSSLHLTSSHLSLSLSLSLSPPPLSLHLFFIPGYSRRLYISYSGSDTCIYRTKHLHNTVLRPGNVYGLFYDLHCQSCCSSRANAHSTHL
jgi:hypothetical protein